MLIKAVHIVNFRSILDEVLRCDPLTAIVGANGAGKSSFLQALAVFYDISARVTLEDFFDHDPKERISIAVSYGNFRPDEQEEFQAYIRHDLLTVIKRIRWAEGRFEQKYYAATLQIPEFAPLRSTAKKTEQIALWNTFIEQNALPGLTEKARRGDDIEALMRAYEGSHAEALQAVESGVQFFGPRNVGGGKLDNFTKFVHLPAVRDVMEDAGAGKTSLSQLLDTLVMRKLQARPDVRVFKEEFSERIKRLYAPEQTADLSGLAAAISKTLQTFAPGATFDLEFGEVKAPELPTPPAIPILTEDGFAGDITRKGHGLQRALIFSLLQHIAVLGHEIVKGARGSEGKAVETNAGTSVPPGPDLILAIEEPELYQHPQRSRYLSELLLRLATDSEEGLGARNQVIYTTHSAYFVSLDRFEQIRLARKVRVDPDLPPETSLKEFSFEQAAKTIGEITGEGEKEFTADRFKARAYPVMNAMVSEGFFANVACVVEGLSEAGALCKIAEILDQQWLRRGIVIIPAGGKDALDKPVVIFRALGIPTYFLFDGDNRHKGTKDAATTSKRNGRCLRLAGVSGGDEFPPTTIAETWACFGDRFESYCQVALGTVVFGAILGTVAGEFGYNSRKDALKNFAVAETFIERVYRDGHHLAELENIAKHISHLASS